MYGCYLGAFKAGTSVDYRSIWDKADTTVQDPTLNSARLESPSGVFTNLPTPVKIDGETGYFGGTVDTTGFASGQWKIRQQGLTDKVKSRFFAFEVVAYDPANGVSLGLSRLDLAISNVAASVWSFGTRTLTSFGSLVADTASAVWSAVTRTLTNYVAPDNAGIAAIKAKTDNLPPDPASSADVIAAKNAAIAAIPPSPSIITTYLGDLPSVGEEFFYKFHTLLNGVPASLTGVTLEIYKDGNSPSDPPSGVTLVTDFNGVTGLNQITFNLADPLYSDHANFTVGFKTGMLGGSLNVSGLTIVSFSILQRMCRINWAAVDRTTPS